MNVSPIVKQYAKNSFVRNGVIYKMVFFDPNNGLVRDVHRCDRGHKDSPDTGTYQGILVGDMFYCSMYNTKTHARSIAQYYVTKSAKIDDLLQEKPSNTDILPLIQTITPTLKEWLLSNHNEPFLPTGIGWDGKLSFADHVKHENAMGFIYGLQDNEQKEVKEFYERYYNAILRTPKEVFKRTPHLLDVSKIGWFNVSSKEWQYMVRRDDGEVYLQEVVGEMKFVPSVTENICLVTFNKTSDGNESLSVKSFNFR